MDPARSGCLVPLLKQGLSFETYRDFLLDTPMLFHFRRDDYRPAGGRTFRDFLTRGINGQFPTAADWDLHLTTVFPEVRLKHCLEIRGADATPPATALAVPAFWKGLLYDDSALDAACDLARIVPPDDLPALWAATHRDGLRAEFDGLGVAELAEELLTIAAAGLEAQGEPEAVRYLDALRQRRDAATTYADVLRDCEF
jgi:glutamate--cysteine ligase